MAWEESKHPRDKEGRFTAESRENFDNDYESVFEDIADNDYIYGGLEEDEIVSVAAKRLGLSEEEVRKQLKENKFDINEYKKYIEGDNEESKPNKYGYSVKIDNDKSSAYKMAENLGIDLDKELKEKGYDLDTMTFKDVNDLFEEDPNSNLAFIAAQYIRWHTNRTDQKELFK